ncbi:MAG: hypothetical protein KKD07_04155 [Candidatus Omnitrophica bacterium]|nr:hypothetical protein [Candidatus Omnitrophota bacterium]MBU1997774.1 hypothetical protein [Candidatus Omnitrophota bacterium]MBU4333617.1 hypothetical protein [Candidatus Omnitrophota bacterium]
MNLWVAKKVQADNALQVSVVNPIQIVNSEDSVKGLRLNFIYGVNENVSGLDFGLINKVNNCTSGMQLGLFNLSYELSGIQFGIVNRVEYLNGLQIGLLNFNKSNNPHDFLPIINYSF